MKIRRRKKSSGKGELTTGDYALLIEPVVTEKSAAFAMGGNKVVFKVPRQASKAEIKRAVEKVFEVSVTSVNTCRFKGKLKRSQRSARALGRRPGFKKAYITLKEGDSINVVEGL